MNSIQCVHFVMSYDLDHVGLHYSRGWKIECKYPNCLKKYSDPSTMSRHVTRIHKKHAPSNPKRTMKERTESLLPTTLAPLAVHSGSDPTVTNCVDYNLSWHMTGELSKEERGSLSVGEHPTTFAPQIHGGFGALNPTVAWDKNFVDHYPDPATAASLCWHPTREHEELPKPKSKTKTELQQLTKAPKPTVKIAEPSPQWNVDLVHFMDSCMPVNVASWHSDTNQIINAPYPLYTHQTSCAAPVPDLNSYGQTSQCCRLDFHPEFPSLGGRSDGVGNYFESLSIF